MPLSDEASSHKAQRSAAMKAASEDALMQRAQMHLRAVLGDAPMALLIDPTLADPLSESLDFQTALSTGIAKRVPLRNLHPDMDPDRVPYVVHLSSEAQAERLITASLKLAMDEARGQLGADYRGRSVCAWVARVDNAEQFVRQLVSVASVVRPDGSPWPLRLWDPRVLWHLPRVLALDAWSAMQSKLGAWYTLAPSGDMELFGKSSAQGQETSLSARPPPYRFNASTWAALERIGSVNKVLAISGDWDVLPTEAQARRIDQLLQRCKALGFETEQDALAFAACGLTSHDRFDEHPQVQSAIQAALSDKRTIVSALAAFDDEFWQALSSGLWLASDIRA